MNYIENGRIALEKNFTFAGLAVAGGFAAIEGLSLLGAKYLVNHHGFIAKTIKCGLWSIALIAAIATTATLSLAAAAVTALIFPYSFVLGAKLAGIGAALVTIPFHWKAFHWSASSLAENPR
jgi:hypothetical protein